MKKENYEQEPLPALFYSSYDEIYNSFVKAIYAEGYKVKYENIEDKVFLNKDTNIISLRTGLNKRTHLHLLLDVFTKEKTNNDMEKHLLEMVIARRIGIENREVDFKSFYVWYQNQDMKDIDHVLKVIVFKGKKFSDNFEKFYDRVLKEIEELYPDKSNLYDDFYFSL